MRLSSVFSCPRPRGNLRLAGFGYLAVATAYLSASYFADQASFTGPGFAFLGLGIAFIARGRRGS